MAAGYHDKLDTPKPDTRGSGRAGMSMARASEALEPQTRGPLNSQLADGTGQPHASGMLLPPDCTLL